MSKTPVRFYWGNKSGFIVTKENPNTKKQEIVFTGKSFSINKVKRIALSALAVGIVMWQASRRIQRLVSLESGIFHKFLKR